MTMTAPVKLRPAQIEESAYRALMIEAAALTEARAEATAAEARYAAAREAWHLSFDALP